MSSTWTSVRPLSWTPTKSFTIKWRDMDLMGGLFIGEELAEESHPDSCGQWLYVQMAISDEWCPSGFHSGTRTV